jgi:hypothetical protein
VIDEPLDPFAGDPRDPARELARLDAADGSDEPGRPLTPRERDEVFTELGELAVFRTLLEPRGCRGLVVDCDDCGQAHYFDWDLLAGNLRHLLDEGRSRIHEPACEPDPAHYVSWDYAKGYSDGVTEANEAFEQDDHEAEAGANSAAGSSG